jgi:pup-like protein
MSASEPLGQEQAQEQELTLASHSAVQDVSEVDDLLDEIDGLLAENAEDFVTGFVQKGRPVGRGGAVIAEAPRTVVVPVRKKSSAATHRWY